MFSRLSESEYAYQATTEECASSQEMKTDFDANGYIIVRKTFSDSEIGKLNSALEDSGEFRDATYKVRDLDERHFASSQWMEVGRDVLGQATRTEKVARVAAGLLGRGDLYLYQGKVIMKPAHSGGSVIWHQDYGYWYNNGFIYPDFIVCFIALTKNDRENGGLEIMKGSQRCGRLEHFKLAGQTSVDEKRIAAIHKDLELVHCDLRAGDVIFFHCNALHRSARNDSPYKRWNLIFSFNAKSNAPRMDGLNYNSQLSPETEITYAPQDAVEKCESSKLEHRAFLDPNTNHNLTLDK